MEKRIKIKTLLSSIAFIFFALLAGGSLFTSGEEFGFMIVAVLIVAGIAMIVGMIANSIKDRNKSKREEMTKNFESEIKDFDVSDKFGDDRCMVYYDKSKKQIMVVAVTTEEIKKHIIENVVKSGSATSNGIKYVVDNVNKNLVPIQTGGVIIRAGKISYKADNYEAVKLKKELFPKVTVYKGTALLVDEQYGQVLFAGFNEDRFVSKSFSYSVSNVEREKSYVTTNYYQTEFEKSFGQPDSNGFYGVVSDDKANYMVIIQSDGARSIKITGIGYKDIISVSYIENGGTISSKSTGRTVGGAVVGGVIAGGAGAIVGGLSGDEKHSKSVSEIAVKLLLRSSSNTSFTITIYKGQPLKTKDDAARQKYEKYANSAQKIKDLISVIIDKVDRSITPQQTTRAQSNNLSVADELTKLADLKTKGFLTDAEFNAQKQVLLGLQVPTNDTETLKIESAIDAPKEVIDAIDRGDLLLAVKLYKEYAGCSLAEAQKFVDSIR